MDFASWDPRVAQSISLAITCVALLIMLAIFAINE